MQKQLQQYLNFIVGRGECLGGKCFCINGFEGEACETASKVHSISQCATICLDLCLKNCSDHQITCYTKCSDQCNQK